MHETLGQRLFRGVRRLCSRSPWELAAGRDWPDRIMNVAVTDQFHAKQGRSTGRWLLESDGGRLAVYLKRHYQLPWWRGLLATLWPGQGWSPALAEWQHLEWARAQGLPVPLALAACEYVGPWGRLQSCLVIEELVGMLPLHQAIPQAAVRLDPATFARWKRSLVTELARLIGVLHQQRRFHKDLYLCHFFIPEADTGWLPAWRGRVHLIDLHRLGHHPWTGRRWQAKDLGQLLYSSEIDGIDARDRLRFWHLYDGARRGSRAHAWLRRSVLIKWWTYRRHNKKRRGIRTPQSA